MASLKQLDARSSRGKAKCLSSFQKKRLFSSFSLFPVLFCQELSEWKNHPACLRLAVVGQPVNHVFCHGFSGPLTEGLERLASGTTHPLTSAPTSPCPIHRFSGKKCLKRFYSQIFPGCINDLGHHPRHSHQSSTKRSDGKCHLSQLKGYQVVLWIDGKIGWTGIGLNATSIQAIPGTSFKTLTGINTQCFFRDILGTVQGWIYHASLASTWHKSLQSLQYGPMVVMWSGRIQNTPDSPLRPCALSAFSTAQTSELIRAWVVNRQRWSSQFLLVYFIWLVIWISISVVLWWFYDIFWFACFLSTESDFAYCMRFADQFHRPWPPQPRWDQTAQPDIVVGQRQFESHRLGESTPNSPAHHEPHRFMQNDVKSKWMLFDCLVLYILILQSQAAFSAGSGCKLTSFGACPFPFGDVRKVLSDWAFHIILPHDCQVWTRKTLQQS